MLSVTREVVSPQRPNLVLSTHIPDIEFYIFVCDCLDVKADCRNGGDGLIKLELVENCCECVVSTMRISLNCRGK